ncbi:uncharacterized protein [Phyllobates terribilis]|uniref:uncharacterized protein n=1 Tax=Phyllobates terribilis TaxID=111132 RepID=UPI003CCAD047
MDGRASSEQIPNFMDTRQNRLLEKKRFEKKNFSCNFSRIKIVTMSSVTAETLLHRNPSKSIPKLITRFKENKKLWVNYSSSSKPLKIGGSIRRCGPTRMLCVAARSGDSSDVSYSYDVIYSNSFTIKRTNTVEGEIYTRVDPGKADGHWQLTVGCNLPGKWILRYAVRFVLHLSDVTSLETRPPQTVPVKDYALDTPMKDAAMAEGEDHFQEVKIDINTSSSAGSVNFFLRDEETGSFIQHKVREFKVPLVVDHLQEGDKPDEGVRKEHNVVGKIHMENSVHVSVKKCGETDKNIVDIETDIVEEVVAHWGVCKDDHKKWEVPASPHPPNTRVINDRALETKLQPEKDVSGKKGVFTVDKEFAGFVFVLRLGDDTWLQYMGNDFFIPLESAEEENQESCRTVYTNGLINNIRSIVSNISSSKTWIRKSKTNQETLLNEIEKLAAQAYSVFRTNIPGFSKSEEKGSEDLDAKVLPTVELHSGTGNGYEILCQGFNWESHKSGRWYMELYEKADYLSSLGFTIIWLPPPTESLAPEGYMPKDLYNLNSRYGSMDELKAVISKFHEVGIKVLGDVVLNHRCAEYKNCNGVWNIFGGRLNWDDRAVVGDDPHFQGRGNKSSGDNFHAAPNIDHSQDFVRRDIQEWMRWLKNEVGYDGWRLDFVRGFWGGYVKDYLDATEPYFSVGEYWDSLSYTYSEMDYDQNAHRQRIIDWINATNGYSGAFDVTTKGVLHSAVGDCQYWRLRDSEGKPPGVVGWWPSRAVTFIENHDTGSTQGHWRFPAGKEMQGYAYILTHSGTPSIFYDHFYSSLQEQICKLIAVRRRNKIHCRSNVQIVKAENELYAAVIDGKVAMKIGPGHYEPPCDKKWSLAVQGQRYKVWETLYYFSCDPTPLGWFEHYKKCLFVNPRHKPLFVRIAPRTTYGSLTKIDKFTGRNKFNYKAIEEKSHSMIQLYLTDDVITEVVDQETTSKLWLKLESLNKTKSLTSKLMLNQCLFSMHMYAAIVSLEEVRSSLHDRELRRNTIGSEKGHWKNDCPKKKQQQQEQKSNSIIVAEDDATFENDIVLVADEHTHHPDV